MEPNISVFVYNEQAIEFDMTPKAIMVNATEMAKIFEKKVENFLRNDETKNFISSCLKNANSRFLGIEKKDDLVTSKQKSGTWMHRVLALKFAAWLNSDFEFWVYKTIDDLLFGRLNERIRFLKQKTANEIEIERLEQEWRRSDTAKKIAALKTENTKLVREARKYETEYVTTQIPLWFPEEASTE